MDDDTREALSALLAETTATQLILLGLLEAIKATELGPQFVREVFDRVDDAAVTKGLSGKEGTRVLKAYERLRRGVDARDVPKR